MVILRTRIPPLASAGDVLTKKSPLSQGRGMVERDRFWFLFARQRKKNPFPSKMEGAGEVEYL
jgi:hypothetical protein